jgi:uncharacterized membrane protein
VEIGRHVARVDAHPWRWSALLLLGAASLSPSLMPRAAVFQGVVTALVVWTAWLLLLLLAATLGKVVQVTVSDRVRTWSGRVALAVSLVTCVVLWWQWPTYQRTGHELVGLEPPGDASRMLVLVVAFALFGVLLLLSRSVVWAGHRVGRPLHRVMAARAATVVGSILVVVMVAAATDRWVASRVIEVVDTSFDSINNGTPQGATAPRVRTRSGSPGSLSPWDELGEQGRSFVAFGPDADEITAVTGRPAQEPIRVYAGRDTSEDLDELAQLAVAELDRTGAWERSVLAVAVPTGRGWVNPAVSRELEYLHGGDTAIVGMQYSYLPSPLAFFLDPHRAKAAGRALFDAVHERWAALPEPERPQLVVYGESLGSTGAQGAFDGLAALRERTDGALFIGPPDSNVLWRELVDRRDAGSPEVLPVYDSGDTARFASRPEDLQRPRARWSRPRVVFLQNASDPVVWWAPELAWQRPDWLREPRGRDVSPSVRWYPLVTFLQLSLDMAMANDVPEGHGHRYGDFVRYWAAIVPPAPDWSDADTEGLVEDVEIRAPEIPEAAL